MRRNLSILLVLALIIAFALVGCSPETPSPSGGTDAPVASEPDKTDEVPKGDPIRIGVVTTLSGSFSGHGEYAKEGAELAKTQINEAGGVLGRPIEIIYEDNGETEQSYVNAAVKALSSDNVCAIYSNGFSNQIELVLPEAEQYGIPYIGGNSSHALLQKGYEYYWMLRLSDRYVSPAMVNACKELGMKNPAILHVSDSYGIGMADYVEQAIEATEGMSTAIKISVADSEQQFTPYLVQIMNSGADGLIAIQHQDQASLVMLQVDALDMDIPLMGCSQYASALAIDTAGDTANGWYSLSDWTVQTDTATGKAFVDAYRAAYNRDPDMQSVTAYDSMYLLKDAIERAGSDESAAINKALGETKDLPGAMTTYTFQGDNSLGTTIFLVQTVNLQGDLIGLVTR